MNRILQFITKPLVGWLNFAVLAVLVGLKYSHVIAWSWWWVLTPLWLSIAGGMVVAGVAIYVVIVTASRGGR